MSFEELIRGINERDITVLEGDIGKELIRLAAKRKEHASRIAIKEFSNYEDSNVNDPVNVRLSNISGLELFIQDAEREKLELKKISDIQHGFIFYPFLYRAVDGIFNPDSVQDNTYIEIQKKIFGDAMLNVVSYDGNKIKKIDDSKVRALFDALFPAVGGKKIEFEGILSLLESMGFEGSASYGEDLKERSFGRLLFEYGLKNRFAPYHAESYDDENFKKRFNEFLSESIDLDILKYGSEIDDRNELRKRIFNYVYAKENSANVGSIASLSYKIGGRKDSIIRSVQKSGLELIKYMVRANALSVINSEKYAHLRSVFKQMEADFKEQGQFFDEKGSLLDDKASLPAKYWKALDFHIKEDKRIAGDLLEYTILLGNSKLIRLKEGTMNYKESGKVTANVVLRLNGDECEYFLKTRTKDSAMVYAAKLANELLYVAFIEPNRAHLRGLFLIDYSKEIQDTKNAEEPIRYITIGTVLEAVPAGVLADYLLTRTAGTVSEVAAVLAAVVGGILLGYGFKNRYTGPKVNPDKDFAFRVPDVKEKVYAVGNLPEIANSR